MCTYIILWCDNSHFAYAVSLFRFVDQTLLDTHTHTHPVGLLRTSAQLVAEAVTYTTNNKQKGQTSMPSQLFELAIPAFKGLHTSALAYIF